MKTANTTKQIICRTNVDKNRIKEEVRISPKRVEWTVLFSHCGDIGEEKTYTCISIPLILILSQALSCGNTLLTLKHTLYNITIF